MVGTHSLPDSVIDVNNINTYLYEHKHFCCY